MILIFSSSRVSRISRQIEPGKIIFTEKISNDWAPARGGSGLRLSDSKTSEDFKFIWACWKFN